MSETQSTGPGLAGRGYRKVREGLVVSDKMEKTIVVEVEDRVKHALYGKVLRRSSKINVHDEANAAGVGKNITEGGKVSQKSYDNNGIANGTQVYAPIDIPINICGNSVEPIGDLGPKPGNTCVNDK